MRISVVVAARNEEAQLGDCLGGLATQDHPVEVLVVDGNSSDRTREVARLHGARVLHDAGIGTADARNRGIAAAQGEIVAFTDADCVPAPGWAGALARRFSDPEVGGVGGAIRMPDCGTPWSIMERVDAVARYRGFITSNVAYRRDVLLAVRGFHPLIRCGEDWDLWWRVLDAGYKVVYEPRAVVLHAPTEQRATRAYLAKQFWYARSDMPTWARRILRIGSRLRRGEAAALGPTARVLRETVAHGAIVAALLAAPLHRGLGGAGALLAAAWVASRLRTALPHLHPGEVLPYAGATLTRCMVRGAGHLVGAAETAALVGGVRLEPAAFRPGVLPVSRGPAAGRRAPGGDPPPRPR